MRSDYGNGGSRQLHGAAVVVGPVTGVEAEPYDHSQPMDEFAEDDELELQLQRNGPSRHPPIAPAIAPPSGSSGLGALFEQKEKERRLAPKKKPTRNQTQQQQEKHLHSNHQIQPHQQQQSQQYQQQLQQPPQKKPVKMAISLPTQSQLDLTNAAITSPTSGSTFATTFNNHEDLMQSRTIRRSASVSSIPAKSEVLHASLGSRMLNLLKRRHNLDGSKRKDSAMNAQIPSHAVAICGTLTKQGSWRQNWKSRFFILRNDQPALCYFNSEEKLQLLGSIPITADTIVIDKAPAGHSPYRIQIRTDSRFLLVEADSKDSQLEWIETLQHLVDGIRNNKFNPHASMHQPARALGASAISHAVANNARSSPRTSFHDPLSASHRNSLAPYCQEDNQLEDAQRRSSRIAEETVMDYWDDRDSELLYDICFELELSRRGRLYRDAKSGEKTTCMIKVDGFSRSNKAFEEIGVTDAVKLCPSSSKDKSSHGSSSVRVCFSLVITTKLERYEHLRVSLYKLPQRQNLGGTQSCIGRGRCFLDDELLRVSRFTRIPIQEKTGSFSSSDYFGGGGDPSTPSVEALMYLFNFAPTSQLAPSSELPVAHARFLLPVKVAGRTSSAVDYDETSLTNDSFLGATTGKGSRLIILDELLCIPRSTFGVAIAFLDYLEEDTLDRLHNLNQMVQNENEENKISAMEREFCRKRLEEYVKLRQLYWRQQHLLSGMESFEDAHLPIIQIRTKAKMFGEDRYLLPFKQSTLKKVDEWQFIPTNMQNQFLVVEPSTQGDQSTKQPLVVWHTMTMGCPAAHTKGFANGGYKTSPDSVVYGNDTLVESDASQTEQTPRPEDTPPRRRKSANNTLVEDSLAAVKSRLEAKDRLDVIGAQVLSAAVACILASVDLAAMGSSYHNEQLQRAIQVGYLVDFESLLSTHGKEWGMIEDFDASVRWVRNVHVRFRLESQVGGGFLIKEYAPSNCDGDPNSETKQVLVTIGLDERRLQGLPSALAMGKPFVVNCVLFTQGVNEKQSLVHAIKSGASKIQNRVNRENLEMLKAYYNEMRYAFNGDNQEFASCFGSTFEELDDLLRRIEHNIVAPSHQHKKTVAVLVDTSDFCRRIGGARVTCCKSGKDRTAMSITLEQARICYSELNAINVKSLCSNMRTHGVRRRNVFMNTQSDKFAFNEVQRRMLPDCYKPPTGTYKTGKT